MTPAHWEQVDQLFHAALKIEPSERTTFLAEACAGDESLRREVESLLSSHGLSDTFFETPAADVAAELLDAHESTFASGQQIENYRIARRIGAGGMGEVYLADDLRLNRKIALKLLPAKFTIDAQRVHRFEQEARAASALNHPNIVTIHEIGRIDNTQFIVTEFVEGQTLRDRMNTRPISPREALEIAIQVAGALEAAHAAGIVHRDIKPENIMIRADGYVKVLDFGLAKLTEQKTAPVDPEAETRAHLKTDPQMVMGTVQYMSPEQARGRGTDARTDLWSLGVVLYEMVSGHVPFEGETPSHVVVSILESEPPLLTQPSGELPAELERIVLKTMRKDREKRYQNAGELAQDLKGLKGDWEVAARLQRPFAPEEFSPLRLQEAHTVVRNTTPKAIAAGTEPTPVSSAEYIVNEVSRHKRVSLLFAALLLMTIIATSYFYFSSTRKGAVRSIAVLPFNNAGNNPDMEYLADGLSESLTNNLSPVPGLTVISRYSSFKYFKDKGKTVDPSDVGKNLGIDAFITGRVGKTGDNYLISIELVDARNGSQIWGKQYNRKSSDVLMVLAESSREITQELRLRLTKAEEQQLVRGGAVNPQAYDLFLKGRALWEKGDTDNMLKAVEYYQQAIAVDPAYALAHAELSGAYSGLITDNVLKPEEFSLKAQTAALRALELDENLAEAHIAVADIKMDAWDWPTAEREIKRALELNPNLVRGHNLYAMYLRVHGRREEAVTEWNRAGELDPLKTSAYSARFRTLATFRQNDQALEVAKKMLELNPSKPSVQVNVGSMYSRVGRYREALATYQEAMRLGDKSSDLQILMACAYAKSGEREKAQEILSRYESGNEHMSPVGLAMVYVTLGERDRAFAALETAYAQHDQQLIYLLGEWEFDVLHDDPRFQDLARRIGLLS
jgi:eukaryotic-like serine/threonine-protein kinase